MHRSWTRASSLLDNVSRCRGLVFAAVAVVAICTVASAQSLDDSSDRPSATFEDIAWMIGSWQGEAFGGRVEEDWLEPSGGTMTGVFKLMSGEQASMYEFMMIVEDGASLELRLKHFDADFSSWEEKADFVSFPLIELTEDAAYFEGLSYRKIDGDRLLVHVSLAEAEEPVEIRFDRRVADSTPVAPSPYAGLETRPIKALSQQEVAAYRAGEGMGFAMAAELNSYPGPKHVLELARELELTPDQVAATRAVFDTMHVAAVSLGDRIVEAEEELDRRFSEGEISEANLRESVGEIARLKGELRTVHLRAHLEMVDVLTPVQRHAYGKHRGYDGASMPAGHHPGMHHGDGRHGG